MYLFRPPCYCLPFLRKLKPGAFKLVKGFRGSVDPTLRQTTISLSGVVCPEVVLISGPEEYLKQGLGGKV